MTKSEIYAIKHCRSCYRPFQPRCNRHYYCERCRTDPLRLRAKWAEDKRRQRANHFARSHNMVHAGQESEGVK